MNDPEQDPTRVNEPVPSGGGDDGPPTQYLPADAPPPPPDRRPWIIAGLLALIVVLLIILLVAQGGDDDNAADTSSTTSSTLATTTTSSSTTTTVKATTTTTAAATTTSAKPVVTVPPAECAKAGQGAAKPGLAASTVYDAWVRGDKACAAALMTPAARTELFSRDGTGATDQFQGCTEEDIPDPHTDCAFTYEGGSTHYLMHFSPTDGWQVYDITQVAD
jgi:hypothetical protein